MSLVQKLKSVGFEIREMLNPAIKFILEEIQILKEDLAADKKENKILLSEILNLGWEKVLIYALSFLFIAVGIVLLMAVSTEPLAPSETFKNVTGGGR